MFAMIGDKVTLIDLEKAPELNGRVGTVTQCFNEETGRVQVRLEDDPKQQPKYVGAKPINLLSFNPKQEQPGDDALEGGVVDGRRRPAEDKNTGQMNCCGCQEFFSVDFLRKCSKCRMTQYCSPKCQKAHWKLTHKNDCKALCAARKNPHELPADKVDRAVYLTHVGVRCLHKGKYADAEKHFRRLLEVDGLEGVGSYLNLSMALWGLERKQEAINYARIGSTKPIRCDADEAALAMLYPHLVDMLSMTGDYQSAMEVCLEAKSKHPGLMERGIEQRGGLYMPSDDS